ncbi:MAG: WbqC family protein [Flavobacteriales bacterium]|nr:WbqC family protein [Flavobacteriales bacterium]
MRSALITQSNYIPWKGYFDMINAADVFVVYDDMQFTKRDWRNRNKIKTSDGPKWLTVPVQVKGKFDQKIKDTLISDDNWVTKHLNALSHNYSKAPFFKEYIESLQEVYNEPFESITQLNLELIKWVMKQLQINTEIAYSWDFELHESRNERLLSICKDVDATEYISGPSAKNYMDVSLFEENDVQVTWYDFNEYPEYPQLFGQFEHSVSILDLIFNTGPNARNYMKSF